MLIFIENTPRAYAWGSRDALPTLFGTAPTGRPQAELWLGDHPGGPAIVAKASPARQTLIELIESDFERYGVDGEHLPFLLKVLGIGAPLSLQVHPDRAQATAGFAREQAAGIPLDARERCYKDPSHKPELLVALSDVDALCGFRPLATAHTDLLGLMANAPEGDGREALRVVAELCQVPGQAESQARLNVLRWAFRDREAAAAAVQGIAVAVGSEAAGAGTGISARRLLSLRKLTAAHPDDPGVLISVLLHLVHLRSGEAVFLPAGQLHAYLAGVGVEVMAASDNVLRAGLTSKHVDADELIRIVDPSTLSTPRASAVQLDTGLTAWCPDLPDFKLLRARLDEDTVMSVRLEAQYPMVLVVTSGRIRVERVGAELAELANVGRGQSLYVSAGEAIELSGVGEAFIATVGDRWRSG